MYAQVFVLGLYLYFKAHSFLKLSSRKTAHFSTGNIHGQISEHISVQNGAYCLCILEINVHKNMLQMAAPLDTCPNSVNPSTIVLLIVVKKSFDQ